MNRCGFEIEQAQAGIWFSLHVGLSGFLKFSQPQFPHLYNGHDNSSNYKLKFFSQRLKHNWSVSK